MGYSLFLAETSRYIQRPNHLTISSPSSSSFRSIFLLAFFRFFLFRSIVWIGFFSLFLLVMCVNISKPYHADFCLMAGEDAIYFFHHFSLCLSHFLYDFFLRFLIPFFFGSFAFSFCVLFVLPPCSSRSFPPYLPLNIKPFIIDVFFYS